MQGFGACIVRCCCFCFAGDSILALAGTTQPNQIPPPSSRELPNACRRSQYYNGDQSACYSDKYCCVCGQGSGGDSKLRAGCSWIRAVYPRSNYWWRKRLPPSTEHTPKSIAALQLSARQVQYSWLNIRPAYWRLLKHVTLYVFPCRRRASFVSWVVLQQTGRLGACT